MNFRLAIVAASFGCSASWVRRLKQRERESELLEPKPAKLPDRCKFD